MFTPIKFASIRKLMAMAPVFLFAAVGFAQTSNIEGNVIGQDGKPLQGAQIKLDRTDIKQSFSVKTDKKGHYLYANLPTGTYTITVQVAARIWTVLPACARVRAITRPSTSIFPSRPRLPPRREGQFLGELPAQPRPSRKPE